MVSASNAVKTLRDEWFSSVCRSPATKTSFYIDNMVFDSDCIAEYLTLLQPSAPLFALIKCRLDAHTLWQRVLGLIVISTLNVALVCIPLARCQFCIYMITCKPPVLHHLTCNDWKTTHTRNHSVTIKTKCA